MASAAVTITSPADKKIMLNVDYSYFDKEDQVKYLYTSDSLTLTNDDPVNAVNATVTLVLDNPYSSTYNVPTSTQTVTVPANGTATASFQVNVTHSQAPGTVKIGTISVSGQTAELYQVTKKMLTLKKLSVDYITDKDSDVSDDFKYETTNSSTLDSNVKVGTTVKMTFEVENLFRRDNYEDSEIDNIRLQIEADNDDIFPSNFDTEYDLDDLVANDNEKLTIEFEIPEDIDTGDYDLTFTLTGEDGQGIEYEQIKTLNLNLKRAKDDLRIVKSDLNPATVTTCSASTTTLDLKVQNYGSDNQKYGAVSVSNPALKINENVGNLVIDRYDDDQDSWSKIYTFNIPATTPAGTYPLTIKAYYDNDEEDDSKVVNLIVEKCPSATTAGTTTTPNTTTPATTTTTPATQTSTVTVVPASTTTTTTPAATTTATATPATSDIVKVTESGYNTEDYMVGVIVVMIVLLLAVVIVLAAALFR